MLRTAAVAVSLSTRAVTAARPSKLRSAVTNNPRSRFDVNSAEGRRARDLFDAYMDRLGNPVDTDVVGDVIAAAELKARAETLRQRSDIDLDQLIRVENRAERAVKALGIKAKGQPQPSALAEYLRSLPPAAAEPADEPDDPGVA
jgi:hypothetical protein